MVVEIVNGWLVVVEVFRRKEEEEDGKRERERKRNEAERELRSFFGVLSVVFLL